MKFKSAITKLAAAGIFGLCLAGSVHAQEEQLDEAAAVVNNEIILKSELDAATAKLMKNYKDHGSNVSELNARKQALQSLVTRSLILQLAKNQGSEITDMELDKTIDDTAFRNNTSKENILRSYGQALTTAQARQKFKEDFLINEVRRASIREKIHISDAEVNSLAQMIKARGKNVEPRYHLNMILIPLSSAPDNNEYEIAKANANAAIRELRSGKNPEEVAAKYARGTGSVDMGYVPETAVPLPFIPALVKAAPGDVIGPFRSQVGLHIVKLIDVNKTSAPPIITYDAAHILVRTSIIYSDEAAIAKLNDIKHSIESGSMTFAQAAKEFSEDPGSAVQGGDLGYALPDRYDPGFARAMVSLNNGEISEPVKSSYGWHLIMLKDKKVDTDSMSVYIDKARNILFEREYLMAVENWERNLRETSYVHVLDPVLLEAGSKKSQGPLF